MLNEQHKKAFLANVSHALGRSEAPKTVEPFDYSKGPQMTMMQDLGAEGVFDAFIRECDNLGIKHQEATKDNLKDVLLEVIKDYGEGKIIYPQDERIKKYGIDKAFAKAKGDNVEFIEWDPALGREANIQNAQDANIGVTFPIGAIAETATLLQSCSAGSGRSIGLLPITHIAILKKSEIYPRMTQSMKMLQEMYQKDPAAFPSNLVHISGPSNTSDIELVKVVGVHGPINVTYILLDD